MAEYRIDRESDQLKIPGMEDPVIHFVLNGLRLSLQQNMLSRQQAVEKVKLWYPEAEIEDINKVINRDIPHRPL